jgi:hypothetical protein
MSCDHVVLRGFGRDLVFACMRCDASQSVRLPRSTSSVCALSSAFVLLHVDCTKKEKSHVASDF